ncbi:MAG: Thymidylate kinase [Candidatus Saccharibacteria bacterium]|nr:Thymidylate kinase [Candidatus Saccharibacteria bacterium]
MQNHQGVFIVLEGADGSGKTTQFDLLQKRLRKAGHKVEVFDFPRYDHSSSYFVKRYLNGEYGPASSINPYTASLFYALDRFEAAPDIRKALAEGKVVLSNRYVGSNMAHQGSKFTEPIEKRSFFVWEDSLEFQILNIPRPDINIFLRVPAEVSFELIGKKDVRSYTSNSHDEHEKDINHLRKSVETYDLLCQLFPRDFKAIECAPEGRLLNIESVSELIWQQLAPILPARQVKVEPKAPNPPVPDNRRREPKQAQQTSFTWNIDEISLLAVGDLKLRDIHLKTQPSWQGEKKNYRYYVPPQLNENLKQRFVENTEKIAAAHAGALHKLSGRLSSREAAASVLAGAVPLAASAEASLEINKQTAIETLEKLNSSQLSEVLKLAASLEKKVLGQWPEIEEDYRARQADHTAPEAIGAIIKKLSAEMLPQTLDAESEAVKLVEASPRNELDLLTDSLYSYSNLPRPEIAAQVEGWNYQQKYEALSAALSKPRADSLRMARYRFDVLSDWVTLSDVLSLGVTSEMQLQPATPRFGYEVAEIIETAGIEEEYLDMFDLSLGLYSRIQAENNNNLVEYAVLTGHRLRWQATFSASDLGRALQMKRLPKNTAALIEQLVSKVKEVHPIIGESLTADQKPQTRSAPAPRNRSRTRKRRK